MEDFQHWQHQLDALDRLRGARKTGKTRIVLQAPPGAGKTEIAVAVTQSARAKGRAVAFTVPMLTLVDQTVKRFEDRGIPAEDIGVLQGKHERTNERAPVQVVSVQTLGRRKEGDPPRPVFPLADVAIIDECHLQYDVVKEWQKACPEITFIGLSATPWAVGMAENWQELIVVETINGLIEKKILSPFRTFAPPQRVNLEGVAISRMTDDYAEGPLSERMREHRLVADVVETWLTKAPGRPTLCFAVDRAHAAALTRQFEEAGVRAQYIDADTEREDRAEYIEQLRTGEVQVIVSIGTLTTGVDIPWVTCVSYVRPTRSHMLFVQSLARGLRAYPGKEDCLILDHSMTTAMMGLVSDIGFDELRDGKKPKSVSRETDRQPPLPRECIECHFMIPPGARSCPECGFTPQVQSTIEYEEGELIEIGQRIKDREREKAESDWTIEDRAGFFAGLKHYGMRRAYKPGWPAVQYKERFGVWPDDLRIKFVPPAPPSLETLAWIQKRLRAWKRTVRKRA